MVKPPLTKQKARWAKNRNVALNGTGLNYNAAVQQKYVSALRKLVKQMTDDTKKQITRLFRGEIADEYFNEQESLTATAMDASLSSQARILTNALMRKFNRLFSMAAKPLAEKMVGGVEAASKTNLHVSLAKLSGGLSLPTGIVTPGTEEAATAAIADNVSYIKFIPQEYLKNVTGAVMRSITTGRGLADLLPEIRKYSTKSDARVKNLALDQTRKAYNSINKQRMQSMGVKQFKWMHSGGGQKPRQSHIDISGTIFNFDTLYEEQAALGVPEKDRGIPGHPVNCKCRMAPVIKFSEEP